jgi:glutamate-1-semialdehyde 2,1-aminomutase
MTGTEKFNHTKSAALFERAKQSIPGGVNSPVRSFKSVGGKPVFMESAKGAYLYDADGNAYIDYINSWGPMILGHCHPEVVQAIQQKVSQAISFGAPTEAETQIAELIKSMVPNIDLIRFVCSGTEACMSALRLARGYTGKNKFIKFDGCYHGHADAFLVKAGSGVATLDIQTVPGVTTGSANDTLTVPYNNLQETEKLFHQYKNKIAAVIVEPIAGNMGCIIPEPGFLEGLRKLCDEDHAVLIFDEVMTGFRLAAGGVQQRLNVHADLVVFGKIIGGGLPVGAFGGKEEIMNSIAPLGNVYQAGTLSGNPVSVISGFTTLSILKNHPEIYSQLEEKGMQLKNGFTKIFSENGITHSINQIGSMLSIHFGKHRVIDFATAAACNIVLFSKFFHHMLSHGIYLPPSAYESWFLSIALSDEDIDKTLSAAKLF